jgi:hypothetical protein
MEFQSPVQDACYQKVVTLIRELFGELATPHKESPIIGVSVGSAFIQIAVWAWGDSDAVISTRAYVVRGAEVTPDLMHFLLRQNDQMRFGAFGLDQEGDIFFSHAILGNSCDKEELKSSVMAVAQTADRLDDEIVARWGGQRAID